MFGIQFDAPGGIEALRWSHLPVPTPASGEMLIRFQASAINPADIKIRSGAVTPRKGVPPFTLGYDLVGTVVDAGPNAHAFNIGSRVVAMSSMALTGVGAWSEFVCLRESSVARAPDHVDAALLAQLPLAGLTALQAVEALKAPKGGDVAVLGAAGAVGRYAVQLLTAYGYRVHAVIRDDSQREAVPDDVEVITGRELAGAGGIDGAIDTAGVDATHLLRPGGHYVSVVPDALPDPKRAMSSEITVTFVLTEESGTQLDNLVNLVEQNRLTLTEPSIFEVADFRSAHRQFDRRTGRRVVLLR